jgi:hypothetical protein
MSEGIILNHPKKVVWKIHTTYQLYSIYVYMMKSEE